MRNAIGYLLGFLMFVVGIPALMWWVSGTPALTPIPLLRGILAALLMLGGLELAVWTIVYMKKCGFRPTGETVIDETQYQGKDRPIRVLRLELWK